MSRMTWVAIMAFGMMPTYSLLAVELPDFDRALDVSGVHSPSVAPQAAEGAKTPSLNIVSWDGVRHQPRMMRALNPQPQPEGELTDAVQAAGWYVRQHRASLGLEAGALESAVLHHVHDTGIGPIVVRIHQRPADIAVLGEELKVLMNQQLELQGFSGTLHPAPHREGSYRSQRWSQPAEQAIATAFLDLYGIGLPLSAFRVEGPPQGDWRWFDLAATPAALASGLDLIEPTRVRPCWYRLDGSLIPAWELEMLSGRMDSVEADTYRYVFAADNGELLNRTNLTMDAQFSYRVWSNPSDEEFRPLNGPLEDYHPHPTGQPDGWQPTFIPPVLIAADGFNEFADPYIAQDQTVTTGNSVDAYADITDPDGYNTGDVRASVSAPGVFDYTYDTTLAPAANTTQIQGAVTQLFYLNNWLHHWWYDSGFNEEAGNAQQDNYGRGGLDQDRLLAEGQDKSGKNNANMSVRSDGASPRMQMYLWNGFNDFKVSIQPKNINPTYIGTAAFGPTNFDLTATLVLMNDGVSPTSDGCSAIAAGSLTGKIVLIDRGSCTFEQKTVYAQQAGAVGVLIANNQGTTTTIINMADVAELSATIPALSVPTADGTAIKSALTEGAQTARLYRVAGPDVDGTIDNTVSGHEWGHYLHKRLTVCSTTQCNGQSEGWADFVALHLMLSPTDSVSGTYAIAAYAGRAGKNAAYYGIRRYPYSIDMTKNPLTFQHISDGVALPTTAPVNSNSSNNAEVHNAGEIWATMLWEAYIAMVQRANSAPPDYTFAEAQRRMGDYIVAGMIFAPDQPTYTEQRDAVLWAAGAADSVDANVMAQGFARRGAGTCAVSPPRDSKDLKGVVESYTLSPQLGFGNMSLTDDTSSCDQDGFLDAGERGTLTIQLRNTGAVVLTDATLAITSNDTLLTFNDGAPIVVPAIEPFSEVTLKIPVSLGVDKVGISEAEIVPTFASVSACGGVITSKLYVPINQDDVPAVSAADTAESQYVAWTEEVAVGGSVWTRPRIGTLNHVYNGLDLARLGDIRFVSPGLPVSRTSPLILTFEHRYKFETSTDSTTGVTTYWDGSVLEISLDNGVTWQDISDYKNPGYMGVIGNTAGNPLMGRQAFVGTSTGYPSMQVVYLNLGTQFAGKTLRIRFRIGTDQASGEAGWDLDNISFSGITTTPFGATTDDIAVPGSYYLDHDLDGFGADAVIRSCDLLEGTAASAVPCVDPVNGCTGNAMYVVNATDCDDANSHISPNANEVCDGVDNNCDSVIDTDAIDQLTSYLDADHDGQGDENSAYTSCTINSDSVVTSGDCNDADASINSGAVELCDSVDNNCDGKIDNDAPDAPTWYLDSDGDGAGSQNSIQSCSVPSNHVSNSSDCDDTQASVVPGATELCNGVDDNCDQSIDENAQDAVTWYMDQDGDGSGSSEGTVVACSAPQGYSPIAGDCNDADSTISPTSAEQCNSIDDNCSGTIDEDALDAVSWFADVDADGYGTSSDTVMACSAPMGYIGNSSDCNDANNEVSPNAVELCDGVDNDCNGDADVNAVDASTWYVDADQDGYGDPAQSQTACLAPEGTVSQGTDCNDQSAEYHPGATEEPGSPADLNCDGQISEEVTPTPTQAPETSPEATPTATAKPEETPTATPGAGTPTQPVVSPTPSDETSPTVSPVTEDDPVSGCDCSTHESQNAPIPASAILLILGSALAVRRPRSRR